MSKWLDSRKQMLARVKLEVRARLGPEPADVRAYASRYNADLNARYEVVTKADLLDAVREASVVYGGDFHALGQAQKTHLKILRELDIGPGEVTIALECFSLQSQRHLDNYLGGRIDTAELKRLSNWHRSWGFPFENYRPLIELAKKRGWGLVALNTPGGGLGRRERIAAEVLAEYNEAHPTTLVYVIFGDLHLARPHLPTALKNALKARKRHLKRDVIIHLNSEKIYFQLAAKDLEMTTDVVRLRKNQYCVLASPPWVQWQSYLFFLEQTADGLKKTRLRSEPRGLPRAFRRRVLDDGSVDAESGDGEFDATDQVADLIRVCGRELGTEFKADDFTLIHHEAGAEWREFSRKLDAKQKAFARFYFDEDKYFFIAGHGFGSIGEPTVNHAAAFAGLYIHAKMARLPRPLWRQPQELTALIWSEACAYFVSKLINHKRQAETLTDLRARLAIRAKSGDTSLSSDKDVLKIALDRLITELVWTREGRRRSPTFKPRRKSSYQIAARILGGMLGERLYMAYRSRNLSRTKIIKYLRLNVLAAEFPRAYETALQELDQVSKKFQPRSRKDRI